MHALELRDNALQWETERQNRLLQSTAEQKKKQMRIEAAQRGQAPAARSESGAAVQLNEWIDKVSAIPDVRSALIPIDDEDGWSKPFSLAKADMEPWLSFYRGYRQSRLFLNAPLPGEADQVAPEASVDYPVRALLELKRAQLRLITEPPVQINGQVEYFDTESAFAVEQNPAQFRALLRGAILGHDKQLKLAEEKGRNMGDALHEALMGEGHGNLIHAWEKVFQRKPTIDELHQMLTAGRVRVSVEKKAAEIGPKPVARAPAQEPPPVRPAMNKRPEPPPKEPARQSEPSTPVIDDDDEPIVFLSGAKQESGKKRTRKLLWHLLHATIACSALAAYIFVF